MYICINISYIYIYDNLCFMFNNTFGIVLPLVLIHPKL